jgi:hypothetical protein
MKTASRRYKYPLQLPESLKDSATRMAKADGVSLNQWIVAAVAQKIGSVETADALIAERASRAKPDQLQRYLHAAPDRPPLAGDNLE